MRFLASIFFALVMAAGPCFAQGRAAYTVDNVPNPRAVSGLNYVSNPDGTLSAGAVQAINNELAALQSATSVEVAVVVVNSIGDVPPEDFGIGLLRKWGVGKKGRDNGMLILLVTGDDRVVRFEVGYGLEGVMTDAMSKRIQTARMMPYLKAGDWDGAMLTAVKAVHEIFVDPNSELLSPEAMDGARPAVWKIILSVIVFIVLAVLLGRGGGGGFLGGMLLGSLMGGRGGGFGGGGGGGFGGFGGGSGGGGGATTRF